MNIQSIINVLIVGGLVLLAFLKLANVTGVNRKANIYFGVFTFLWATFWLDEMIIPQHYTDGNPLVLSLRFIQFFVPITFYFSVKIYSNPEFKYKLKDVRFLIVPSIFLMLLLTKEALTDKLFRTSFIVLVLGHSLFYTLLSYIQIRKHQRDIELFSSDKESIDLRWIKYIIFSFIASAVLIIVYNIFSVAEKLNIYINIFFLVVVYFVAYYSIKQKEIFPKGLNIEETIKGDVFLEDTDIGGRVRLLNDTELNEIKTNLLQLIDKKAPYLDSELNLLKLADELNVSSHQLSYVLNEGFGENFFYFINKYRVQKAQELLSDPKYDHLSMLAIGYEAGFNSKTSFNTTFKKMTSFTPSEYRKNRSNL